MRENTKLKSYQLTELSSLKVYGRTTGCLSPLTMFWTGTALELNVTGSELWIEVEADYEIYEPWISILINSVPVGRQMITAGKHWICVFRTMNDKNIKNVRIIKDVQAMSADPECCLQIHTVKSDGEFMPIEEKPCKIEFIGDSITSGEGAIGAKTEEDWIPMWFSAINNYAYMTAQVLNADYRIISQSGWGVYTSWDNNPHGNIPDYYEKVCGLLTGEKNQALGAFDENNFIIWQPDFIVVNLGTNDAGAFNNPKWTDEATGESHQQRLMEDGSFHKEDLRAFINAAEKFLKRLRNCNHNAYIIWAYGMIGDCMLPAIRSAIEEYRQETGDKKVSLLKLPDTTMETIGARQHPGKLAHQAAAKELIDYIRNLIS